LANCFSNSILASHISKVDLSKHPKPEEKKLVEPLKFQKPEEKKLVEPSKHRKPEEKKLVELIKIRKHVEEESLPVRAPSPPPPPPSLKLKINLKNASVSKPKVVEKIPLQQPILGKLVVRKNKKAPVSKSILFPPVTSSCRDDLDHQEEIDERRKSKKKSKKEKRREKKMSEEQEISVESETRKVPKLVIKRDVIVQTPKSSRKKRDISESVSSPPPVQLFDTSYPIEVLSSPPKTIKILPLKISTQQSSDSSVRPGPKSSGRKRPRVEVLPQEVETEREKVIVRTSSRSNSAGSTDSDNSNRRLNQKCSVTLENIEVEKLSSDDRHDETGVVVEMVSTDLKLLSTPKSSKKTKQKKAVVPKLTIKLGPSTSQSPESGKQLSIILTDLAKHSTQLVSESDLTSCMHTTKSFDEILKERSEEKSVNVVDEFEHTCVVKETDIGNALNVLLSMEAEKEIVGKLLEDLILAAVSQSAEKVATQDDTSFEMSESEVDDQQSFELRISDDDEAEFESKKERTENKTDQKEVCSIHAKPDLGNELNRDQVKPSLKVTLTRKENHFVANSIEEREDDDDKPAAEFAVIRVPSTSARVKPKRAGSGLSGSDYTKRRGKGGRRKLDKLIIKNLSRVTAVAASKGQQREEEEAAAEVAIANDSERVCSAIVQQLIDSLFQEAVVPAVAVADVVIEERKVPPLKIKSSQIKIKKHHHHKSRREDDSSQRMLILNNKTIVKEEDVFYKKVVPPLKLILGAAKNPEIVKEKPVVRTLKVTLSKLDLDPILLTTTKTSEEVSERSKEEKTEKSSKPMPKSRLLAQGIVEKSTKTPKRKLSEKTEELNSSKKLKVGRRKSSTVEGKTSLAPEIVERPNFRGKKTDFTDSQSQERSTPSSSWTSSNKGSVEDLRSETTDPSNIVELASNRRRNLSAAAQIEKTSFVDPKKKISFPNVEPELNRRHSLHSIDTKLKNLSRNAISTFGNLAQPPAKPLLVVNPPFFARKSAPKIVQPEDEESNRNPIPVRVSTPEVTKVAIPEVKKPKVAESVACPLPEAVPAKKFEQTVEENVVIRKAINQIRQTPNSVQVFSMIDELFDNVMDRYKFDKPEKNDSELISGDIVDELVDSVVGRINSTSQLSSKIEETQKMEKLTEVPAVAETPKPAGNEGSAVNEDHSTSKNDSEKKNTDVCSDRTGEKNVCSDSEIKPDADVEVEHVDIETVVNLADEKTEKVEEEEEVNRKDIKPPEIERRISTTEAANTNIEFSKSQKSEMQIVSEDNSTKEETARSQEIEEKPKQIQKRSRAPTSATSSNIADCNSEEPKIKVRRNTRAASVKSDENVSREIVSSILFDMMSGAVFQSETLKPRREDVWESIVATARPAPELVALSPEMRFSSEIETDGEDDSSQFSGGRDLSLRTCLPYQVRINFRGINRIIFFYKKQTWLNNKEFIFIVLKLFYKLEICF